MDKKTLVALQKSIKKYERHIRNVKGAKVAVRRNNYHSFGLYFSIYDCALCKIHFDGSCEACPIKLRTGIPLCNETPYTDIFYFLDSYSKEGNEELIGVLQAEVNFLKSLLPEGLTEKGENSK